MTRAEFVEKWGPLLEEADPNTCAGLVEDLNRVVDGALIQDRAAQLNYLCQSSEEVCTSRAKWCDSHGTAKLAAAVLKYRTQESGARRVLERSRDVFNALEAELLTLLPQHKVRKVCESWARALNSWLRENPVDAPRKK